MKSAYLYVRASAEQHKSKDSILAEQKEHLVKHCKISGIRIKGIHREEHVAVYQPISFHLKQKITVMKSAYLYVRASAEQQKRKDSVLAKQEEHLVKHCEIYGVKVKGICLEDYSANH